MAAKLFMVVFNFFVLFWEENSGSCLWAYQEVLPFFVVPFFWFLRRNSCFLFMMAERTDRKKPPLDVIPHIIKTAF